MHLLQSIIEFPAKGAEGSEGLKSVRGGGESVKPPPATPGCEKRKGMKRYSRGMLLFVMAEKEEEYSTRQNLNELKEEFHGLDYRLCGGDTVSVAYCLANRGL